jgi:hypothetical protein
MYPSLLTVLPLSHWQLAFLVTSPQLNQKIRHVPNYPRYAPLGIFLHDLDTDTDTDALKSIHLFSPFLSFSLFPPLYNR